MDKKKLLFVCIENSNRSQMSQAFAKILGNDRVVAYSAGSDPSGKINPKAIAAMKELGYDLSLHQSIPDPKEMNEQDFRKVRDMIKENVKSLLALL